MLYYITSCHILYRSIYIMSLYCIILHIILYHMSYIVVYVLCHYIVLYYTLYYIIYYFILILLWDINATEYASKLRI